ncbi:DUF5979 domain-containing protein [Micromonospora sp. C28SCA-DRY-2]|uniref:DUF5979 domain-containing protein n=1 Tax=Micromonospora sp. C28SCA-DRY-2 TaxID=3059522 RepID=UPI00267474E2|nr:DUF5979 domain-containing protein [Micromonospora sp. C28SCA-DRY-2]MDO3703289.1 DUF5979 domain-containing protein [Micromonospora sp. C28SCA-DRY-2]
MNLRQRRIRVGIRASVVSAVVVGATTLAASPGYAQLRAFPSDPRAEFHEGNATTCAQVGEADALQMGAPDDSDSADDFVAGTVESLPQGQALNVAITPAGVTGGVVVDAVVVKGSNGYNVYRDPAVLPPTLPPPQRYISPRTEGGNIPDISHWFVCYHTGPLPSGSLLVRKLVIPPLGRSAQPLPDSYTVRVNCPQTGIADVTFESGGGSVVIPDLVAGDRCTVVELEQPLPAGTVVTGSPSTVEIAPGTTVSGTITNDFSRVAVQTGTVQVVKRITGAPTSPPASFTARVECDTPSSQTVSLPATGGPADAVTVTAESLCRVEEIVPAGWTVSYSVDGAPSTSSPPLFTVENQQTVTVTVTNTPPSEPGLPVTGAPTGQVVALAGIFIASGSAMLLLARSLRGRCRIEAR